MLSTPRTRQAIQWGLIAIVTVMPFHAFLSVWLGLLFGHQAAWQSWKELLSLVLLLLTGWYLYRQPTALKRWQSPLWYSIAGFIAVAGVVTAITQPGIMAALFGAKTDLEPLVLCAIAAVVADQILVRRLTYSLLLTSAIVVALALAQIYLLPKDFLVQFGYNAQTIAPYMIVDPVLNNLRAFATLGGALQLGSFLILPLALTTALMVQRFRWWQPIMLLATVGALWHTHSRAAWGGAIVALGIVALLRLPSRWRLPFALGGTVALAVGLNLLIGLAAGSSSLQYYVFHGSLKETGFATSTELHGQAIEAGQRELLAKPLGQGLGTAGPASYQTDRPFIPESQYLQIGVELGFIGLALFIMLQLLLAAELLRGRPRPPIATALVAALGGVAVINLALHGWADSSTALVYWTIAGAYVGSRS